MSSIRASAPRGHLRALRMALAASTGLLLVACAPKVQPSGLISTSGTFDFADDRDVKIRRGPDVSALEQVRKVWEAPTAGDAGATSPGAEVSSPTLSGATSFYDPASTKTLIFVIEYPGWGAGDALTGEDRVRLVLKLRQELEAFTRAFYDSPVLIRYFLLPDDPLASKSYPIYVESMVTQIGTGFGPARHVIGYGLGRTSIQVEGRFRVGSPKGPTLAEYAVRATHSGNPMNGLNVKVYSASYCLQFAVEEAAYKVMNRIKDLIPPPPLKDESKGSGKKA